MSVLAVWVPELCPHHLSEAGELPSGEPRCPGCRQDARTSAKHQARLERLGWSRGRPPDDPAMRAANDQSLFDD